MHTSANPLRKDDYLWKDLAPPLQFSMSLTSATNSHTHYNTMQKVGVASKPVGVLCVS